VGLRERERYFDVEGVDDVFDSDVDFESDFLALSFDFDEDDSDLESDLSEVPEDSEESFDSFDSLESDPLVWRFAELRLSVRWKPEPLNTMPTGWSTLASLPPHPACFFSGSSENDCHSSISSPHFAHS
jgi:hypothetical protein